MKIKVVRTPFGLNPLFDEDYDKIKKLKFNETYEVDIKEKRNIAFHRKYFALISYAWECIGEAHQQYYKNNKELFRKAIEVSAGYCDRVYDIKLKRWIDIPISISFDKMDELEFQNVYNDVLNVLLQTYLKNIKEDELNNILKNFN